MEIFLLNLKPSGAVGSFGILLYWSLKKNFIVLFSYLKFDRHPTEEEKNNHSYGLFAVFWFGQKTDIKKIINCIMRVTLRCCNLLKLNKNVRTFFHAVFKKSNHFVPVSTFCRSRKKVIDTLLNVFNTL